jgi:hypothetical protein
MYNMNTDAKVYEVLTTMFKVVIDFNSKTIAYIQFIDKSISTDRFYITYTKTAKGMICDLVDCTFDNNKTGEDNRSYSLEIVSDNTNNYKFGALTMDADYKLTVDNCRFFYDLNISISYYNEDSTDIIDYNEAAIKRCITINDILQ